MSIKMTVRIDFFIVYIEGIESDNGWNCETAHQMGWRFVGIKLNQQKTTIDCE